VFLHGSAGSGRHENESETMLAKLAKEQRIVESERFEKYLPVAGGIRYINLIL